MTRIGLWLCICLLVLGIIMKAPVAAQQNTDDDTWIMSPTVEVKDQPATPGRGSNAPAASDIPRSLSEGPSVTIYCGGRKFTIAHIISEDPANDKASNEISRSLYFPLEDQESQKFLKCVGAMSNWSSKGDVLFIASSGRDIYFGDGFSRMKFKSRENESKRGYVKKEGMTYLPLYETIQYLGLTCTGFTPAPQATCRVIPGIDDIYVKEDDGTRKLFIHTSMAVSYKVESEDYTHVALRFPETAWEIPECNGAVGDFQVSYATDKQDVRLQVRYPSNWDGRLLSRMTSGDISIELMPGFPLLAGYRAETIDKLLQARDSDTFSLKLCASGPIHYFWSLDSEKKLLIIDFPLLTAGDSLAVPQVDRSFAPGITMNSFVSGYGATRFYISLGDQVGFDFSSSKDDPYALTIRLKKGQSLASSAKEGKGFTSQPEAWGTVVIDAGHGGCDPGACNGSLGLREKDLTLDMAFQLGHALRNMGWKVIFTRTTDRDVSWAYSPDRVELQSRCDVANINGADAFISIHCNASVSPELNGTSVHWCKDTDLPLAQSLKGLLGNALDLTDKGMRQDGFYVLRHTKMPAVLVETAFLSNYRDAVKLASQKFREKIALTLATGLNGFMSGRFAARKSKVSTLPPSEGIISGSSGTSRIPVPK